jgi:colanic acid/amylovoran biosynthesis protein
VQVVPATRHSTRLASSKDAPAAPRTSPSRFFLVGNGTYLNRGCEAINVSTVEILRSTFGRDTQVAMAAGSSETVREQIAREQDPLVSHFSLDAGRLNRMRIEDKISRAIGTRWPGRHRLLLPPMRDAAAVLEAGGDNYSLDYGEPWRYVELDAIILRQRKPLVLWGASVGPFTSKPEFERLMAGHLRRFTRIFVRESLSVSYLQSIGVSDNVHLVADPAFVLPPREPTGVLPDVLAHEGRAIAINLSPLVANYGAGGLAAWRRTCVEAVSDLARRFGGDLLFVGHVFQPWNDDYQFLADVSAGVKQATGIEIALLRPALSAAEIKWCLARCRALIGARTHATIASLSSGRPTLSIAYSMKARGINIDTLGTTDYCLPVDRVTPETLTAAVERMLEREAQVCDVLRHSLPLIKSRAFGAGRLLAGALA